MTELVLVRHGETVWHHDNRYAGRSDVALTDRGRDQAEQLARWAGITRIDAVHTSPLQRARDTAEPAGRALGVAVAVDERLVEVDFGRGDGLTRDEMRERFPAELDEFLAAPASSPLPGGEPGADAVARARPALDEAVSRHPDGTVLVVGHQTLLRLLLCALLEVPLDRYRTVFPRLENGARTVVRVPDGGAPGLLVLNAPLAAP
ncbi:hypothetical protein GCM10023200_25430 [Actinomycetospora chlora]|uniref:Histidine phosphatase family protein n=1 Tax=Actinomycetospora chlora TaxID=663608 RepID=A0ABP9B5T3_9PSEU